MLANVLSDVGTHFRESRPTDKRSSKGESIPDNPNHANGGCYRQRWPLVPWPLIFEYHFCFSVQTPPHNVYGKFIRYPPLAPPKTHNQTLTHSYLQTLLSGLRVCTALTSTGIETKLREWIREHAHTLIRCKFAFPASVRWKRT